MKDFFTAQNIVNFVIAIILLVGFLYFGIGAFKYLMKRYYGEAEYHLIEIETEDPESKQPNAYIEKFFEDSYKEEEEDYNVDEPEIIKIEEYIDNTITSRDVVSA